MTTKGFTGAAVDIWLARKRLPRRGTAWGGGICQVPVPAVGRVAKKVRTNRGLLIDTKTGRRYTFVVASLYDQPDKEVRDAR